jgi:hypothetical protein
MKISNFVASLGLSYIFSSGSATNIEFDQSGSPLCLLIYGCIRYFSGMKALHLLDDVGFHVCYSFI